MADKEKVRKAIGFCQTPDCRSECPYKDNGIWCVYSLMYDAHAVIEEQEARIAELEALQCHVPQVMTQDEVRSASRIPVWLEVKSKHKDLYRGWVLAYEVQKGMGITGEWLGMTDPSGRMHWLKLEDYGRLWRIWTAEPSEAQKKAVKWE